MVSQADADQPSPQVRGTPPPLGDLLALGTHMRTDDSPASLLREVAEALHRVVASPQVYVRLRNLDTDALEAVAFAGMAPGVIEQLRTNPVAPSLYQTLMRPERRVGDSFLIPAEAIPSGPAHHVPPDTNPLLVPLRGRGDRLIGVVYVALPTTSLPPDPALVTAIEAIVRQGAMAVDNVRLAERSARLLAKEQLLAALGRDVSATLDLAAILQHTIERVTAAFGSGVLALLDPDGMLEIVATAPADLALHGLRDSPLMAMLVWTVTHGRPYFTTDTTSEPDLLPPGPSDRSVIVVPLRSGGQVLGTLHVASRSPQSFTYDDVDLLEAIAAQVGGPINSACLYQQAQRLAAQVQRRADQLAVLNAVARAASASLDHEGILPAVTSQVRRGFDYPQMDLFLFDEDSRELVLAASEGIYPTTALGHRQHVNLGMVGRAAREGRAICAPDAPAETGFLAVAERAATRSELAVPIIASGRLLGVLNLESPTPNAFTDEDINLLETVADVLAGALENVRLYRKAQAAAVLEERNRLARDLHDSVTQQLFSMTLTAQAARTQLERNPGRVAAQLERLQETATAALAEMRALIFQLRPPALRDQGLVAALQQHAQVLSRREGIAITLNVIGDDRLARGVEQPLYRIVQEALNNVFKHAAAQQVQVALEFSADQITVRVRDDGTGFEVAPTPSGGRHLGMLSMRERAAEIGGSFELHSSPGYGTEVRVVVPRSERGSGPG
ncbi:MAG: GAF domain-containing protein [Oscillochloridaceae bacterium umkhey_bin13]